MSSTGAPAEFTHPLACVAREPHLCIWEITSVCNLHCVHCENHSARKGPRELTLEQLFATAASLHRLADLVAETP